MTTEELRERFSPRLDTPSHAKRQRLLFDVLMLQDGEADRVSLSVALRATWNYGAYCTAYAPNVAWNRGRRVDHCDLETREKISVSMQALFGRVQTSDAKQVSARLRAAGLYHYQTPEDTIVLAPLPQEFRVANFADAYLWLALHAGWRRWLLETSAVRIDAGCWSDRFDLPNIRDGEWSTRSSIYGSGIVFDFDKHWRPGVL